MERVLIESDTEFFRLVLTADRSQYWTQSNKRNQRLFRENTRRHASNQALKHGQECWEVFDEIGNLLAWGMTHPVYQYPKE